jgi:hypothetical protein
MSLDSGATAAIWTCDGCGVTVSRIDGTRTELPATWASSDAGRFCLLCRRDLAADAAIDSAPADSSVALRAQLRRAAVIEFEVRRSPDRTDRRIAEACRSSAAAVAKVRDRLNLPAAPRCS